MINLNDEIKDNVYNETNCNSIYNSLVITHKKITNCCGISPIKIKNNEIKLKKELFKILRGEYE